MEKPNTASTNTVPPKLAYKLGFGRQARLPRGHKPHVQPLKKQSHHLNFWWWHWEPWLWLPRHLAGLQQKSCATAAPCWPPPSRSHCRGGCDCSSPPSGGAVGHNTLKEKNASGAKIKISQQGNLYAQKHYQPKSHRVLLSCNLIIEILFRRRSFFPRRTGWWPAAL